MWNLLEINLAYCHSHWEKCFVCYQIVRYNIFLCVGSGSQLLDFRIAGCKEQPCKIRKGEPLPFEVDLSFERPKDAADDIYFNVYLPKYAKPPAAHGSSLFTGTCGNGNLGFSCPANPDAPYTLKSSLYIEPEAVCTAKCENIGVNGTVSRLHIFILLAVW